MHCHLVFPAREIVRNVRGVKEVVCKILFDDVLLVARADDKLVVAVVAVKLHDMEQDGHTAQVHHGLGFELAFFRYSGAETAG